MILDKLENIGKYNFDTQFVIDDLAKSFFDKGRFEIDGRNKFGLDLSYTTQVAEKALWEAHRLYLDIHVILEGEEYVDIADISLMKSSKDYEEDYELFTGQKEHSILLRKGYFLMLFPHEVHKTTIAVGDSVDVKKKVYKLLLNE